jgi:putative transcriptional regulator
MPQRLHDRRASQAVLISSLPCDHPRSALVGSQLDRLRELLIDDRRWGIEPENCIRLAEPTTAQEVLVTLTAAGKSVDGGLLLVYFAGHIVVTADRHLYLTLPGTRPEALEKTAIRFSQFAWGVRNNAAGGRLLVMDCCHDGLPDPAGADPAVPAADPAGLIAERSTIERTCLLVTAPTDHRRPADVGTDHGGFSRDLNTLLTDGLPHGPIFLDVGTVAERIPARPVDDPSARHWLGGTQEPVVLARNFAVFGPDRVGQVLCAAPFVDDPELNGAVVFILRYDRNVGALGVIINRPGRRSGRDVAHAWTRSLSKPKVVFEGGPTPHEGYIMLVGLRDDVSGDPVRFRRVSGAVGVMPLSYEPSAIATTVARSRLFSGYLGWSPGELETDLAQQRLVPVDVSPDIVFSDEPESLWSALRRLP